MGTVKGPPARCAPSHPFLTSDMWSPSWREIEMNLEEKIQDSFPLGPLHGRPLILGGKLREGWLSWERKSPHLGPPPGTVCEGSSKAPSIGLGGPSLQASVEQRDQVWGKGVP